MFEDIESVHVSKAKIINWEDDSLFDDGLQVNTDPRLDPDRTQGSTMTQDQVDSAEKRIRRSNQRKLIIATRKMAYELDKKTHIDNDQNKVLRPLYGVAMHFKLYFCTTIGLIITALVLGALGLK